jgi:hypothetical protein
MFQGASSMWRIAKNGFIADSFSELHLTGNYVIIRDSYVPYQMEL